MKNHTYPDGTEPTEADNFDQLKQRLRKDREDISALDEAAFRRFQKVCNARKEGPLSTTIYHTLEGTIEDYHAKRNGNIALANFHALNAANLKPASPDVYYGARPEQITPVAIRTKLFAFIEPSTQNHLPVAPNFFIGLKGPDGRSEVAENQAR